MSVESIAGIALRARPASRGIARSRVVLGVALLSCTQAFAAQPGAGTGDAMREEARAAALGVPEPVVRLEGTVRQYLMNEFGEVDGVLADDGTAVHFPPLMGPDLVVALAPGDRFVAEGSGTRGAGFQAYSLGRAGRTPLVESRPSDRAEPRPPMPRPLRDGAPPALHVDGAIAAVLRAPRGEVDGIVLADGAIVRLPPRSGVVAQLDLQVGRRVTVDGYGTRNRYGTSLRAARIGVEGKTPIALQPPGPRLPVPPRDTVPPVPAFNAPPLPDIPNAPDH